MKIKVICQECGNQIEKNHWNVEEGKPSFCNKKCANKRLNREKWKNHIPKRELFKCERCGKPRDGRAKGKICLGCVMVEAKEKTNKITVGELKEKHKSKNAHWYSAEIRNFCRMYNSKLFNRCQKCGYDNHVELCHIKPINSFEDSATVGEINDPSNVVVLCPNHHWEFDNSVLKLEEIGSRKGI